MEFCTLCRSYATEEHLRSLKHQRRLAYIHLCRAQELPPGSPVGGSRTCGPPAAWGNPAFYEWKPESGNFWCNLCWKNADDNHVLSERHQKRVSYPESHLSGDIFYAAVDVDTFGMPPPPPLRDQWDTSSAPPQQLPNPRTQQCQAPCASPWQTQYAGSLLAIEASPGARAGGAVSTSSALATATQAGMPCPTEAYLGSVGTDAIGCGDCLSRTESKASCNYSCDQDSSRVVQGSVVSPTSRRWRRTHSAVHGQDYFYCEETGHAQWELPPTGVYIESF